MKHLIEKQLIQGKPLEATYYTNLDSLDYDAIYWGFKHNAHSDACFQKNELNFKEYISDRLYTGDQLLYYPELAKQIRKFNTYPFFNKKYTVDKEKTGLEFLTYITHYAAECSKDFNAQRLELYKNFNHIIQLYGYERYLPIINYFQTETMHGRFCQSISINGVKWYDSEYCYSKEIKKTEMIHLRSLFQQPSHYRYILIHEILAGTPFIAIQCCTNEYKKGHVFWYDLSTLEKTTRAKALQWKKPTF